VIVPWLTINSDLQIGFRNGRAVHASKSRLPLDGAIAAVREWISSNEQDTRLEDAVRWLDCAEDQLEERRPSATEREWRDRCGEANKKWRSYLKTVGLTPATVERLERAIAGLDTERMQRAGLSAEKIDQIFCEDLLPFR
jgi:hypothetical protein